MNEIEAWLYAASLLWSPMQDGFNDRVFEAIHFETKPVAIARRKELARAIATVAFDPAEKPLFGGPSGRLLTALFVSSIASFESGYHKLVHSGHWRGDHGRSWCHMQLNIGLGTTSEGWSGKDLIKDPVKCFRAGLHVLQTSAKSCISKGFTWQANGPDIFSEYMSGTCFKGNIAAHHRWNRAFTYFKKNPVPVVKAWTGWISDLGM